MSANEQLAPEVVALRPFCRPRSSGKAYVSTPTSAFAFCRLGPPLASMHLGPFAFLL
jgi:hypothetical protein